MSTFKTNKVAINAACRRPLAPFAPLPPCYLATLPLVDFFDFTHFDLARF